MDRGAAPEDEAWLRFCVAAQRFCDVIESVSEFSDADSFYAAIAEPLAVLYAAGLTLPWYPPSDDDIDIDGLGSGEWRALFTSINALTGNDDPYRTVFDPHNDTDLVEAPLAGDLADVYRDVQPVTTWDDPDRLADLQFEVRSSFQGHWGRHAVEAMRAIHWRRGYW